MELFCGSGCIQELMYTLAVRGTRHASKVVLKLMEDLLDNSHALYMDNFYNSLSLSKQLLDRKTYCMGTLRSNLKENPSELAKKKDQGGRKCVRIQRWCTHRKMER